MVSHDQPPASGRCTEREESLSILLRCVHGRYAQYYNARWGRTGHLWQSRFFACVLGEEHLWAALAYVERNPNSSWLLFRRSFDGRLPFCAASTRSTFFSRVSTNSAVPNGRPGCVHYRISSASASAPGSDKYCFQVAEFHCRFQGSSSSAKSDCAVPQGAPALAIGTLPACSPCVPQNVIPKIH